MSFLDDIRKQPRHHREIMFGLCVVTAVSLVGMVWYNSFQQNLYALLNPDQDTAQKFLATAPSGILSKTGAENKNTPSLFSNISQTGKDLRAAFYSIFNLNGEKEPNTEQTGDVDSTGTNDSGRVYLLPISGSK